MKNTRNRPMLALAAAGFALALIASSGGAQNARQTTLVYGGDFEALSLDPGVGYDFTSLMVDSNAYETLVRFEGKDLAKLRPGLASSWKVSSTADGTKMTFKLRAAKFASGRPVTANDVVYSLERVIAMKAAPSFLITDIGGVKPGGVKAIDAKTVEINVPKTTSAQAFLSVLAFSVGSIVDSEEVKSHVKGDDYGSDWLKDHSAGSGPFVLTSWERSSQITLEKNPNSSQRRAKLSRVVLKDIKEADAQRIALESGEIDIADSFTPEMFKAAASNPKMVAYKADSLLLEYLGMNSGPNSPFADARVRQAVRYAIDQDGIINDLLGGLARKTQTIIPFGLVGANPATPYKVDIEKAKALLKAAGKENGFEFDLTVPQGSLVGCVVPCADIGAKLQSDFAKIGLKANVRMLAITEMLKLYRASQLQMILFPWIPDFPDSDGNGTPFSNTLGTRNAWKSAEAAKLAELASLETNTSKRTALYKQLTEYHLENGWSAILYQAYQPVVLSEAVQGFDRNALSVVQLEKISKK